MRAFPTAALLAFLSVGPSACRELGAQRDDVAPSVAFVATPSALEVATQVTSGYVWLSFTNRTDSLMAHELVRLKDGVSAADGIEAALQLTGALPGNPLAALAKFDGMYGGAVFVKPGVTKRVGVSLPPGNYVSYADIITPQGPVVRRHHVTTLKVRGEGAQTMPTPQHQLDLVDYSFTMPRTVNAGRSLWRIRNAGVAPHLVFISRIKPGHSFARVKEWISDSEGAPPIEDEALTRGVHVLSAGLANDVELDLAPGRYVVICFLEGHHVQGMVQELIVR